MRSAIPCLALATFALSGASAMAAFDIQLTFGGGLTPSQQAIFTTAEQTWESILSDYKPGVTMAPLAISASGVAIDGVGGTLGQAGPQNGIYKTASNAVTYLYATNGIMQFDSADLGAMESSGGLQNVILHEMAHVIGFGTLWTYNNVYVTGSGQYTGADALAAWRYEYNQPSATFVPVEAEGGGGTADGHWNEAVHLETHGSVTGWFYNDTGILDRQGRDLGLELMTGWAHGGQEYISQTTIMSFSDIGYAVPEPGAIALLLISGGTLTLRRRRGEA